MTDAAPANRNARPDPLARLVREVRLKALSRIRNRLPSSVSRCGILAVFTVATACAAPLRAQDRPLGEGATLGPTEPTCADLFAAPPFDDILTRNGGRDMAQLRTRFAGSALRGVLCSREAILEYVGPAGWTLDRELFGLVKAPNYRRDEFYEFCIPGRWFGVIPDPCQSWAQFYLFEGRITEIKVSGGL